MRQASSELPLVRSRQRVIDHGEVFTPSWMVEDMLDLVGEEAARIDSRFLEPACGSGNFLVAVLRRKLLTVQVRYGASNFEKKHHALLALMSIYGIELLEDNAAECRQNLLDLFQDYLGVSSEDLVVKAARVVLDANIVRADALTLAGTSDEPIAFPEWGYLGKGKYQRRDFRYDSLTQRSSLTGTLFGELEEHEVFVPCRTYAPMSIKEIAG